MQIAPASDQPGRSDYGLEAQICVISQAKGDPDGAMAAKKHQKSRGMPCQDKSQNHLKCPIDKLRGNRKLTKNHHHLFQAVNHTHQHWLQVKCFEKTGYTLNSKVKTGHSMKFLQGCWDCYSN